MTEPWDAPEFGADVPLPVPAPARRRLEVVAHQLDLARAVRPLGSGHRRAFVHPVPQDAHLVLVLKKKLTFYCATSYRNNNSQRSQIRDVGMPVASYLVCTRSSILLVSREERSNSAAGRHTHRFGVHSQLPFVLHLVPLHVVFVESEPDFAAQQRRDFPAVLLLRLVARVLEDDGLELAAVLAAQVGVGGPQHVVGRTAEVRDALVAGDHPDDHVGDAVLRLPRHKRAFSEHETFDAQLIRVSLCTMSQFGRNHHQRNIPCAVH